MWDDNQELMSLAAACEGWKEWQALRESQTPSSNMLYSTRLPYILNKCVLWFTRLCPMLKKSACTNQCITWICLWLQLTTTMRELERVPELCLGVSVVPGGGRASESFQLICLSSRYGRLVFCNSYLFIYRYYVEMSVMMWRWKPPVFLLFCLGHIGSILFDSIVCISMCCFFSSRYCIYVLRNPASATSPRQ